MSQSLLGWYDRNARDLPWRIPPELSRNGIRPDPYRVWLSEVMLQQTTVAAVRSYFERFTRLWPTVADLARAEDAAVMAEWAGLGYYARARNLLKCARVVTEDHVGTFPSTVEGLRRLPGIGPYTAAAIAAIAFGARETVVDGNVERVMARLYDEHTPLPKAKPILTAHAAGLTPQDRAGDYAQAVMDLGATICTPRNPACGICPWREPCLARQRVTAASLPKKEPKKAKPVRFGFAYVGRRSDGAWLLETRPERGLLGGMLGWPGSDWNEKPDHNPPAEADWRVLGAEARHTFTHFHLRLQILTTELEVSVSPAAGQFLAARDFRPSALPTVMRKVFDLAAPSFPPIEQTAAKR
jgi:A/G-specific adenine glycosylase